MEGTLYKKLKGNSIQCTACNRFCTIKEGETGFCGVRRNNKGKLDLIVYGKPCAIWADPIEKKPLFHFLPGTKSYSLGTYGCNFSCSFCFTPENTVINDDSVKTFRELFEQCTKMNEVNGGTIGFAENKKTITASGQKKEIKKVFRHFYEGEILAIRPRHAPAITCTPGHKFFVYRNGAVKKVAAQHLKTTDYLIIPKIRPKNRNVKINSRQILEKNISKIKRGRKLYKTGLMLLLKLKEEGKTSREIGRILKMHPTYLRKLIIKLRKEGVHDQLFHFNNTIIERNGRVKFKMEKGNGIPKNISVNKELAELLGYYCAEGHTTKCRNRPTSYQTVFSYGHHENRLIIRTKELLKKIFDLDARIIRRRTTTCVEVGKSAFGVLLTVLCGRKAREKKVPSIIAQSSNKVIKAFLKAFISGDGCILKDNIAINSVSKKLSLGIYYLFLLLGYLPSFYEWKPPQKKRIEGRVVNQSTLYYVKLKAEKFRERFLGNARYKLRKKSEGNIKFKETQKHWLVPIFRIERKRYSGYVYNCEVEGEHSYLANFIGVSNCQNWDISQAPKEYKLNFKKMLDGLENLPPTRIIKDAIASKCRSISYTYNEPAIFTEYAHDIGVLARKEGLKNIYVTNGYQTKECWDYCSEFLDAANIDLKGDEKFYQKLCGKVSEKPVKESIKYAKDLGIWVEVTTLIIPGENDDSEFLKNAAEFLHSIDPEMPWHVTAFHPDYKMKDIPPAALEILIRARSIGEEAGLKNIYCGNVISKYENTVCTKCKKNVIERWGFEVWKNNLKNGKCSNCGNKIGGVFE